MSNTREKLEVIAHLGDHITYKENIGICYDSDLAKLIEDAYMELKNGIMVQERGEWVHPKGYVLLNGFLCAKCGHKEASYYPINPRSGGCCIADENGNFRDAAVLVEDILKIKATDAEPVRHGHWIEVSATKRERIFKCSVCGNVLDFDGVNAGRGDANYCPNCGADMRGSNDE